MNTQDIKTTLKTVILNEYLPGEDPAASTDTTPLMTTGILDSIAVLKVVTFRYTEYMTDMFAGRIYPHERQPTPALLSFRKLLSREGERERSYESGDLYSIPIGSRYHPERAAIWEVNSPVETTEKWLGPR